MAIENHYTVHQVAEKLGLHYETALKLVQTGEIASVRVGRLRRIPESAVTAYLNRHRENVIQLRPRVAPLKERKEEAT